MPPKKKTAANTEATAATNSEANETVLSVPLQARRTATNTIQKFSWTAENDRAVRFSSHIAFHPLHVLTAP